MNTDTPLVSPANTKSIGYYYVNEEQITLTADDGIEPGQYYYFKVRAKRSYLGKEYLSEAKKEDANTELIKIIQKGLQL